MILVKREGETMRKINNKILIYSLAVLLGIVTLIGLSANQVQAKELDNMK